MENETEQSGQQESNNETPPYAHIVQEDPVEHFFKTLLSTPAAQKIAEEMITAEQKVKALDNQNNIRFWNFLIKIDKAQKWYNLFFVIICSAIVGTLKYIDAIGQETCQTLLTLIIGVGVSNAISSFFKATKE